MRCPGFETAHMDESIRTQARALNSGLACVRVKEEAAMAKWKCGNCGYELEADKPPEKCPSCKESCEFLDNTCYTPDCEYTGKDDRIR